MPWLLCRCQPLFRGDDDHLVLSRKAYPDSTAKQFLFYRKTGMEMQLEKPGNITVPATGKSVYIKGNDVYFKQGDNTSANK
jgi:hypothetical protein